MYSESLKCTELGKKTTLQNSIFHIFGTSKMKSSLNHHFNFSDNMKTELFLNSKHKKI